MIQRVNYTEILLRIIRVLFKYIIFSTQTIELHKELERINNVSRNPLEGFAQYVSYIMRCDVVIL